MSKKTITLERTFTATLQEVWDLWTTKDGIESWWGPEGFSVTVRMLDLRPGGTMEYSMRAIAPPQIEFMKKAGMPVTTETQIKFTEIVPRQRLAYENLVDFVPGIAPYSTPTVVELKQSGAQVKMTLQIGEMHDDVWTQRAVMGWESEIGKLEKILKR